MSGNQLIVQCLQLLRIWDYFCVSSLCMVPVWLKKVETYLKAISFLFGDSLIYYVTARFLIQALILKVSFDIHCLIFDSTCVRPKIFKPYKTKKLTIICLILLNFSTADCPAHWVRHNNAQGELVCCNPIKCDPGFYVRTCQMNGEDDVCIPCDVNTFLLDSTNSSYPVNCVTSTCPPETVHTFSFPPPGFGCRLKCRCDKTRGFFGKDPCNCKRSPESRKKNHGEDDGQDSDNLKSNTDHLLKTATTIVVFVFGLIVVICCAYLIFYRNEQGRCLATGSPVS